MFYLQRYKNGESRESCKNNKRNVTYPPIALNQTPLPSPIPAPADTRRMKGE